MSSCTHPALFKSLCVICGKEIAANDLRNRTDERSSLTISGGKQLQLTSEEANRVQALKISGLRKSKKLALVLDLDHTLLHAMQVDGSAPPHLEDENGYFHLPIEDIVDGSLKHLKMRKRPELDKFLEEAYEFCQMSIYTAGTRRYAEAVSQIIDPSRKYFADRIVSRSDVPNIRADGNEKSLERIFLNDTSMAVIMDDREDVWRGSQSQQLLLVRPYYHFYGLTKEVNNSSGPMAFGKNQSDISVTQTEMQTLAPVISLNDSVPCRVAKSVVANSFEFSESDDQLMRSLTILKEIHQRFYGRDKSIASNGSNESNGLPSVGAVITEMKKNVLAGCTITFSGVISTNEPSPENHMMWKLAESLGAQVSLDLIPRTTHLISLHTTTQKVTECLQRGDVWVLHPDWLYYCRWAVARAFEVTFMLTVLPVGKPYPNPVMDYTPLTPKFRRKKLLIPPVSDHIDSIALNSIDSSKFRSESVIRLDRNGISQTNELIGSNPIIPSNKENGLVIKVKRSREETISDNGSQSLSISQSVSAVDNSLQKLRIKRMRHQPIIEEEIEIELFNSHIESARDVDDDVADADDEENENEEFNDDDNNVDEDDRENDNRLLDNVDDYLDVTPNSITINGQVNLMNGRTDEKSTDTDESIDSDDCFGDFDSIIASRRS
eukprot:gene8364-11317_t